MKLSCIIVEDEPLAFEKLQDFIGRVPFLKLISGFENAIEALEYLKNNCVDIVFLDIQMEHLTGIQFLETIKIKPYIIITSAYAEYALKGYELQVFDYLLKPYSFDRFLLAVNKVYDDSQKRQHTIKSESQLFIKTEYRVENITIADIIYIQGMQGYLRIFLTCKKIMTKQSFKSLLMQLPEDRFVQVHKSWVVNITKIESIERNRIKIADQLIPIGDSYRQKFYQAINT